MLGEPPIMQLLTLRKLWSDSVLTLGLPELFLVEFPWLSVYENWTK